MYTNRNFGNKKPDSFFIEIQDCPKDTISDISCNFESTHVAISSWDCSVKLYKLIVSSLGYSSNPNLTCEKTWTLPKPCLSVCFFNSFIVTGLVDGSLGVLSLNGTQNVIPAHSLGIKSIKNFGNQFFVTGSFDSTLKFWDLKSTNPIHSINLPGKVYCMDLKGSFLAIALSNKSVQTYDLTNATLTSTLTTKFNYSIRSISCANDNDSVAVGGIEAKVEVLSKTIESKKLVFRCHRVGSKLYSSTVLKFHPNDLNIILSGGSDGSLIWFDRANRYKLNTSEHNSPITAADFTNDGKYLIFGVGDDWSKGYTGIATQTLLKIVEIKNIPGISK